MREIKFEHRSFGERFKTMLLTDLRRMLKTPFLYIVLGICLVMPILILVMTTMMDGSVSVDPQTGKETVIEGFDNVWQIIGSVSTDSTGAEMGEGGMDMGITSMCNINMLYFLISILVCVFVGEDFRCGYAKNLFTVRAEKTDYVASKTVVCFIGGALMILAFFLGSLVGGAVAGLPFDMVGFNTAGLIFSVIAKMLLVSVFVPIYLVMAVVAKNRIWLSILLSMMVGMFLFMMIPMLTPLNASVLHVFLCAVGSALFGVGLGAVSNIILKKTSLV